MAKPKDELIDILILSFSSFDDLLLRGALFIRDGTAAGSDAREAWLLIQLMFAGGVDLHAAFARRGT